MNDDCKRKEEQIEPRKGRETKGEIKGKGSVVVSL